MRPSKTKDADEQATPTSPARGKCTAKDSYSSTTSKNKRRQCSLCPFFGTHLGRHIASKHPDAAQTKSERVTLVHLQDKLARQKQGKKAVCLYQCSLTKCGAIITRLGQHLKRVHKIHDKAKLKKIKSTCKRLPPASQPKQKSIKVSLKKPSKRQRPEKPNSSKSSTSSEDESFVSDGSTSQEHQEVDHHQLQVDADVDDISSFADSDEEEQDIMSDTEQKKWADIYLAKDPTPSVREYFISRFFRYLLHVEGGAHSEKQALIHTRQVHTILETLDPGGADLGCLAKRSGVDIWDKFCLPKLKSKQLTGNTLKVYLRSTEFFVKFISKGLLYKQEKLNERHKDVIVSLKDRLLDYRATIHRRTGHQTTTRKVDEALARLTPADLRQAQASEPAKAAVKLIGLAAENKPLTLNEFIAVRDYLLVTTLYENGSRPGPLENCLVSRFKQATYSSSADRYTILVDEHKTTRHHGPAELTVTSRIYSYLQIYLLHIRPKFAAPDEDSLFIKDDGHCFRPGTIGKRVCRFFEKAGIHKDIKVTATSIRKMISDKAYEMSPKSKRLIHGHLKHNERTAESNYVLRVNAERACKAHELVQTIIQETAPPKASEESDVAEKVDEAPTLPVDTEMKVIPEVVPEEDDDDEEDEVPSRSLFKKRKRVLSESDDEDPEATETASVRSLSDEHKSVILTVFQEEIAKGKLLTMAEVRSKMRADLFLRKMVVNQESVKKIADFVRYKTNHTRHLQLSELTELDPSEYVASFSTESGLRKTWNAHDTAVIEAKFSSLPHVKSKKSIINVFSSDEVLNHILEREGSCRCYEKVKNIIKRRGR